MNVVTTLPIMQLGSDFVVESFRTKLMIILVTSSWHHQGYFVRLDGCPLSNLVMWLSLFHVIHFLFYFEKLSSPLYIRFLSTSLIGCPALISVTCPSLAPPTQYLLCFSISSRLFLLRLKPFQTFDSCFLSDLVLTLNSFVCCLFYTKTIELHQLHLCSLQLGPIWF